MEDRDFLEVYFLFFVVVICYLYVNQEILELIIEFLLFGIFFDFDEARDNPAFWAKLLK